MKQFELPKKGEKIYVLKTTLGDIHIRLFCDIAPKACENFVKLSESGYYNGVKFHRVINDFMIQSGDPTATGAGGSSFWGSNFKDEFDVSLRNFRGALSMANYGPDTNGSQFFIVQKKEIDDSIKARMTMLDERLFPKEVIENYEKHGGTFWLDFKHTVFGQVVDGMDIVDKIASVDTDYEDRPIEDVVINEIVVEEFEG